MAQAEIHAIESELASIAQKTDVWRERARQGATAEARLNAESLQVRRLSSELDCFRRESEELENELHGSWQSSSSVRGEAQTLEIELRSLAEEAAAWKQSAEVGASMHAHV